ncbi:MAG: hypothetical protein WDZ41_02875 [Candidatus Babeliales bacterium]
MHVKNRIYILLVFIFLCASKESFTIFGINLFRPYDINLRPPIWCGENFQWTDWVEIGYKARGYNPEGNEVNVMQLWTPTQDALAMLKGFNSSSPITQFLINDLGNPPDNGVRGNFRVTGDFKAKGFGIGARYHLPHNLTVGLHLPFYQMRLKNVNFVDLTYNNNAADMIVREELTSQLKERIREFDPNLNIMGWEKIGPGDLFFLAEWYRNFPQGKPILKNVSLNARVGFSFPTGIKKDEDDILTVPFGFDGSAGLLFAGGINLNWFNVFRGGIDIEFLTLFGNTRDRRIKVQQDQTEFLLLAKVPTYKDFGFTQRFNLYLEAYRVFHGLSARATYQFWKHSEDTLSVCTNEFSNEIANTAESLQEWTIHHVIFQLSYDFQCDISEKSAIKPQLSLFYKLPFNGERALLLNTYGATFTLNF